MKKIFLTCLIISNLFAHTITATNSDDGIHYRVTGYCSGGNGTFQGNYTPSLNQAYVCGPNGCINGNTRDEAINKTCANHSSNNYRIGYIKKKAIIFSKRTGENSIEKALSWNRPTDHSKGNRMWTMELATIRGELPTNARRTKARFYKKYTKPSLSGSYWSIKDGGKTRYIAEEDIEW